MVQGKTTSQKLFMKGKLKVGSAFDWMGRSCALFP